MRNKEKEEIDFLITYKERPWLAVEAKLTDETPSRHWAKFLHYLPGVTGLQLVGTPGVRRVHPTVNGDLLVVSASDALGYFV